MLPPFIHIRKKNIMDEEKCEDIVFVSVMAILGILFGITAILGILFGITAIQAHLAAGRQVRWQAQVDSIPVTVTVTDYRAEKTYSVCLDSPVEHDSRGTSGTPK